MSQNGKGSRPRSVKLKTYQENFDKISWAKKEFIKKSKKKK